MTCERPMPAAGMRPLQATPRHARGALSTIAPPTWWHV